MKQKDVLLLIISSFTLIVFWIAFNVYHNIITSTIPETLNIQITPIDATFDTKTISALKQRVQVAPIYSPLATQSATVPPPPANGPTMPPATQSAAVQSATQSGATNGGQLR